MTQRIGQGGTITIDAEYREGTGVLVDPVTPLVDIINPNSVELVTNATPTRVGTGIYQYAYVVSPSAPLGLWTARWSGAINGVGVSSDDQFQVVAAGDIGFDPDVLVTVAEVMALANVTLSAPQQTAMTTLLADWTAELEERLNRPLTVRRFVGEQLRICANGLGWTRHNPIVSIDALRDPDGVVQVAGQYTLASSGGIDLGTDAAMLTYVVDYTAGCDAAYAQPARSVLLARAARMAIKMAEDAYGVSALTQEGYNAPYLAEGWTEQELQNIDRRRRRVVRTA